MTLTAQTRARYFPGAGTVTVSDVNVGLLCRRVTSVVACVHSHGSVPMGLTVPDEVRSCRECKPPLLPFDCVSVSSSTCALRVCSRASQASLLLGACSTTSYRSIGAHGSLKPVQDSSTVSSLVKSSSSS